jgi:phosphatidate cytidylyltransferase
MKRVLTAVVLIPLVLLVLFKAPMWLFTLVVGVVAIGAAWEYLKLVDAYGLPSMKVPTLGLVVLVFALAVMDGAVQDPSSLSIWIICCIMGFPFVLLALSLSTDELPKALPRAAASSLAVPYVLLTLLCLPVIRHAPFGVFLILFTFTVVWSGDIFAYYFGRAFGKHKLAPRVSPGKTWEGAIASFVGSVFLAHMLFVDNHQIMDAFSRWHLVSADSIGLPEMSRHERLLQGIMLGAAVNVAAQFGDLVESMIKRGSGVKDSGTLLPGHGGVLDRIDALLFALPIVCFYALSATPLNI